MRGRREGQKMGGGRIVKGEKKKKREGKKEVRERGWEAEHYSRERERKVNRRLS